ncbi:MAG: ACT domain-containing protein [Desulfurococcales archaeon]|nr:ACT domain-containing protein [Desulfurococcales archaeon]MEB3778639.1 ACT domain-containing protein [Desulfurococcales archaeon]
MSYAKSISDAVRRVIDSDPCVQECLERRVVSYSGLAKKIQPLVEKLIGSPVSLNAVKIAITRYKPPEARGVTHPRRRIIELLANSTLELRTGVSVLTAYNTALGKVLSMLPDLANKSRLLLLLFSINTFTIIIDREHLNVIRDAIRDEIVEVHDDQTAVIVVSPHEIVETPGFVAYITSLVAREGLNITQIESSYTDTILIMRSDEAIKAFNILLKSIEVAREQLSPPTGSSQ